VIFWLVLKLEISYRVIIWGRILVSFRGFFDSYIFCMVKYLSFHNSSFALIYSFTILNDKATQCDTPLCFPIYCVPTSPPSSFGLHLIPALYLLGLAPTGTGTVALDPSFANFTLLKPFLH
jgi:hypothetical protein